MAPEKKAAGKGERTRLRLIQAALYCLAHYGERDTTFQKIADHCGVSQPLVVHYFKSRDNIFRFVLEDFLTRAREKTVNALRRDLSPLEKLRDYLRVSVSLFRDEPEWARLYLMLFYFAGFNDEYRRVNSEVKRVAVNRIAEILREGIADGTFVIENVDLTAKIIHVTISGLILNMLTENLIYPDTLMMKTLGDVLAKYTRKGPSAATPRRR